MDKGFCLRVLFLFLASASFCCSERNVSGSAGDGNLTDAATVGPRFDAGPSGDSGFEFSCSPTESACRCCAASGACACNFESGWSLIAGGGQAVATDVVKGATLLPLRKADSDVLALVFFNPESGDFDFTPEPSDNYKNVRMAYLHAVADARNSLPPPSPNTKTLSDIVFTETFNDQKCEYYYGLHNTHRRYSVAEFEPESPTSPWLLVGPRPGVGFTFDLSGGINLGFNIGPFSQNMEYARISEANTLQVASSPLKLLYCAPIPTLPSLPLVWAFLDGEIAKLIDAMENDSKLATRVVVASALDYLDIVLVAARAFPAGKTLADCLNNCAKDIVVGMLNCMVSEMGDTVDADFQRSLNIGGKCLANILVSNVKVLACAGELVSKALSEATLSVLKVINGADVVDLVLDNCLQGFSKFYEESSLPFSPAEQACQDGGYSDDGGDTGCGEFLDRCCRDGSCGHVLQCESGKCVPQTVTGGGNLIGDPPVISAPAVVLEPEGKYTVYITTTYGQLFAVDQDGVQKWHFNGDGLLSTSSCMTTPVVGPNGNVYFVRWNNMDEQKQVTYVVAPDGTMVARLSAIEVDSCHFSPAIDLDGNLYFPASYSVCKTDAAGNPIWCSDKNVGHQKGTTVLDKEGYVVVYDDGLRVLSPVDGSGVAERSIGTYRFFRLAIGSDNTIFAFGSTFYGAYKRNGAAIDKLWEVPVQGEPGDEVGIMVDNDGTSYIPARGTLYAIDKNGNLRTLRGSIGSVERTGGALTAGKTIWYGPSNVGSFFAYNLETGLYWHWVHPPGDNEAYGEVSAGPDGKVFVGFVAGGGGCYGLYGDGTGLMESPWPKSNHDARNTNNALAPIYNQP
jgi:hypothetical protein